MVSNFTFGFQYTTLVFVWDPPQEPNGILLAYELTYRANGGDLITQNSSDVDTTILTLNLAPSTTVSDISVRAYTSVGPGAAATTQNVIIPFIPLTRELTLTLHALFSNWLFVAMVMNVRVMSSANASVTVSWEEINITGFSGYMVYYGPVSGQDARQGEMSVLVPNLDIGSTVITGLMSGAEYQFQVAVTATFQGQQLIGERSNVSTDSRIDISYTSQPTTPSTFQPTTQPC